MKRGFTLVELLCVIVIISVISLITVPIVNNQISASREALYKSQISDIIDSSKKWATDNTDLLDKNHINTIYISLNILKDLGYLEKDKIINPKTKKEMNGCIQIKYDNNTYNYDYQELGCTELSYEEDAFIIYDNVSDGQVTKNANSKEKVSAALFIIDRYKNYGEAGNILRADGQTDSGLYDLEDEYVFRGNDVDNYVNYQGKDFRILSINKKTNSIKLISTDGITGLWGDDAIFNQTVYYGEESVKYKDYKIDLNSKWDVGIVANTDLSRNAIKQEVKSNESSENILNFGLISIYDYINASTNEACSSNFKDIGCASDNYLKTMFIGNSVWTLNRADNNNLWIVNSSGNIELKNKESLTYHKYIVLNLDSSVYISDDSAAGTKTAPYVLK